MIGSAKEKIVALSHSTRPFLSRAFFRDTLQAGSPDGASRARDFTLTSWRQDFEFPKDTVTQSYN